LVVKRKVFVLWELPQLLLSLALLAAVKKKIFKTLNYRDTNIYFVNGFPGGISLSYIIILNARYTDYPDVIKHEYGHSRQSLMLGWFYLPVVGLPSLIRSIIWNIKKLPEKDYYNKFPENWANKLGRH
jgi:hypothetical protein